MKKHIIIVCMFVMLPLHAYPACTGSSPTWTSTPDSASIQSCIDQATAQDTINVTAGEADWAATSVVIPRTKPLKLIGAGSGSVTITLTGSNALYLSGTSGDPYLGSATTQTASRVSGFYFISPEDTKRTAIVARGQWWRVDNCKYKSFVSSHTTAATFINATNSNSVTYSFPTGLVDNNEIINGVVGTSTNGGYDAAHYATYGFGSGDAVGNVYIEDNNFHSEGDYYQLNADTAWASGYVTRYNTFTDGRNLIHGLQDDVRGSTRWEMYGNIYEVTTEADTGVLAGIAVLSGTGKIFANKFVANAYGSAGIVFSNERSSTSKPTSGKCDGTSGGWDGDTPGEEGWPCRDQIGRGKDASLWSEPHASNLPAPAQESLPAYTWMNYTGLGVAVSPSITGAEVQNHIKENRDYYNYIASPTFDGTAGVGCGTLVSRPATCTTGVGYWATDQSCSDLTGLVGVDPATPIAGTLYKCTSTNTWTAYYTPYSYPHPLRGGTTLYTQTPNSGTGFSFSPSGAQTVNSGATTTFSLACSYGYKCSVSGCGGTPVTQSGAGTISYTTAAASENCNVTAVASKTMIEGIGTGSGSLTGIGSGTGTMTLGN